MIFYQMITLKMQLFLFIYQHVFVQFTTESGDEHVEWGLNIYFNWCDMLAALFLKNWNIEKNHGLNISVMGWWLFFKLAAMVENISKYHNIIRLWKNLYEEWFYFKFC